MTSHAPSKTYCFLSGAKQPLTFESQPIQAVIKTGAASSLSFDGFVVSETVKCVSVRGTPAIGSVKSLGTKTNAAEIAGLERAVRAANAPRKESYYTIRFAKAVGSATEIDDAFRRFETVRQDLASVWQYVFGFPYGGHAKRGSLVPQAIGWIHNRHDVLQALPGPHLLVGDCLASSMNVFEQWPLKDVLNLIGIYRAETPEIRFLMELHAQALTTESVEIRMTLFGKLAEMCQYLLPGGSKGFLSQLPVEFKSRLFFDSRVFGMANEYALTRHAVDKYGKLRDLMSSEEIEHFQSDIDTLARSLVCMRHNLKPRFYEGWRYPANTSVTFPVPIGKQKTKP